MFVDLDWPLNASSLLSASAEFLVFHIDCLVTVCQPLIKVLLTYLLTVAWLWTKILLHQSSNGVTNKLETLSVSVLTAIFPGELAGFIEAKGDEVVVTTGAISHAKLQSNHHHQQTNNQFFTGRLPFLSPNQQCQSTEGKISHSMDWREA